jgi:hypothetical protein
MALICEVKSDPALRIREPGRKGRRQSAANVTSLSHLGSCDILVVRKEVKKRNY